jgi:nicotinate-nucleotide adenylyltransferase
MQGTEKLYNLQSLNFMKNSTLKVGILGGSFNPAHRGHYMISVEAIKAYNLDYVIWLIANQNPLKPVYKTGITERANAALSVAQHPKILVSDAESQLGTFYIYDSLKAMNDRFPKIDFTWLMGIDNLENFHKWHNYNNIPDLCKIIVFDRPGRTKFVNNSKFQLKFKPFVAKKQTNNIMIHRGRMIALSSSEIRKS